MYLILVFIFCAIVININKPLQMDELSTFFHCSSKSYHELGNANISGVNMIPPSYFYLMWGIDSLFGLNKILMRVVPLIFGILSIIIVFVLLRDQVDDKTAIFSIFTVFTHCPIFLFSICEARPYSMYFFLVLLFIYISSIKENNIVFFLCIIINLLIPSTFYFGGIYCISICAMVCIYRFINNLPFLKYFVSSTLGWLLFLCLSFPTFLSQVNSTYTSHLKNIHHIHSSALFSLQGMQVYFPITLAILVLISFKRNNSIQVGFFYTFISTSLLLVPIITFLICKFFQFEMFQERYFIPSTFFYIIFYCTIIHRFQLIRIKSSFINIHLVYCFLVLTYLTSSYAKAFSYDDFSKSLKPIQFNDSPVFTFSRRVAFQLSYENYSAYLIVGDKNYSNHMISFSKHLNPIPLDEFYSTLNQMLNDFDQVFYVSTPWVNENLNEIKRRFSANSIIINDLGIIKSNQINSVYSLSKY